VSALATPAPAAALEYRVVAYQGARERELGRRDTLAAAMELHDVSRASLPDWEIAILFGS
jgi:hypothetical protein